MLVGNNPFAELNEIGFEFVRDTNYAVVFRPEQIVEIGKDPRFEVSKGQHTTQECLNLADEF